MGKADSIAGCRLRAAAAPKPSRHAGCDDPAPVSVASLTNALLTVLLAPACAACGAVLDTPLNGCVCRNCWLTIPHSAQPILDTRGVIANAGAVGEYEGSLKSIIHAFKYDRRRSLAVGLAAFMCVRAGEILEGVDCLVPVPLHPRRERQRGFNQARELAMQLGLPVVDALVRLRHTPSQVDLAAERRHANVQGAFALRRRWLRRPRPPQQRTTLDGLTVVLIDDVSTTGATLEACAVVLLEAGAREVRALTAARVTATR
jgi:ComF family protein